mmetsp:Transcript_26712/g.67191  ORF Transcript_26712/g.67191 Transcript_26712/m.67191 type:complete len:379 (+) Transcript_26712:109-1245(+)
MATPGEDEGSLGVEVEDLTAGFSVELDEAISAICVNPSGSTLAASSLDDEVLLIDVADGTVKRKLEGHSGGVNSLGFLSDALLVSAGEDGTAALWEVESGKLVERYEVEGVDADRTPEGHTVSNVAVSVDGKAFAVSAGKAVHIISVEDTELVDDKRKVFPAVGACVEDLKFLPSGELIAGYYGGVSIWSPAVGEQGLELPFKGNMLSVSATPDKAWIIAGCHDATVHIWHLTEGGDMQELTCGGYEGKVTSCEFDPSYRWMASTGGNRNVVWDFSGAGPAGSVPTIALGHTKTINCQAWNPEGGAVLATGGKDGNLMVYRVESAQTTPYGQAQAKLCFPAAVETMEGDEILEVVWGKGGRLYSGHMSGKVRSWVYDS